MILLPNEIRDDPTKRWNLDDLTFFSAGACHILAHAFLQKYPNVGYRPIWIKPNSGFRGNHIFVTDGETLFDASGYHNYHEYLGGLEKEMQKRFPEWGYQLIELQPEVLISEKKSKEYDGLWLREPKQFLHDALPRAMEYLKKFDPPLNPN